MTNYYKIPRISDTGRKFETLEKRAGEIGKKMNALKEKYGYSGCYTDGRAAYGGIVAVIFPGGKTKSGQEIDTKKIWKKGEGGIDAGWCGFPQSPADADGESCEDNPTADEKVTARVVYDSAAAGAGTKRK